MTEYTRQLQEELFSKLEEINQCYDPKSFSPDMRLTLISSYIETISLKLNDFAFANVDDEVIYFKSVLPEVLSLFVYYTELFEMETVALIGTPKAKNDYLQSIFERIDVFFQDNGEFFRYYRFGKTYLDEQYFRCGSSMNRGNNTNLSSSTCLAGFPVYSIKIATLLVYIRLEEVVRQRFGLQSEVATESAGASPSATRPETGLIWTDTKNGLVELIYSFKEVGAFNHGKASLQEITEGIEKAFSITIGNPTRTFQELSNRKISTTLYLDEMKAKFLARTDRNDERHVKREAGSRKREADR